MNLVTHPITLGGPFSERHIRYRGSGLDVGSGGVNDVFIVPSFLRPVHFYCLDASSSSSNFSDPSAKGSNGGWETECVGL